MEKAKTPLLTKEEERLLLKDKNNPEAHKKLVDANMGLVLRVAKLYKGNGVPVSVLVERGKKGLIEAIEKFDCKKNETLNRLKIKKLFNQYVFKNDAILKLLNYVKAEVIK